MAGGASPPPSDLDVKLQNQIRSMFAYADDRAARVSLIQSILKKNQEHALPSDLPKDLILEAKVRAGKTFKPISLRAGSSAVVVRPSVTSGDRSDGERSAPLRMETAASYADVVRPVSDSATSGDSSDGDPALRSAPLRMETDSAGSGPLHSSESSLGDPSAALRSAQLRKDNDPAGSIPFKSGDKSIGVPPTVLRSAPLRSETASDTVLSMLPQQLSDQIANMQGQNDDFMLKNPAISNRWSSLFKSSVASSRELEHCKHPSADPEVHVEFDDADTSAAKLNWGNALVGYFIGHNPSFFAIKFSLEKAWRVTDLEIISMSDGFYLFKFNNYDAGQVILDNGPWFVHGHPLVLRRWTEDIEMHRQSFETIPIWVRLPNLNFCFRTNAALSKIASVIGRPICMDHATAAGTRYAFARVCIEVGIEDELPAEIRMKYKGKTIVQKIEYAWKPNPCKTCKTFDHGDKGCPQKISAKPKQVWVPIQSAGIPIAIPNDPITGTAVHGEWTVVKERHPSGKSSSPNFKNNNASGNAISPKGNVSDVVPIPATLNQFSSLSTLDGASGASLEDLAATSNNVAGADPRPIPGKKMGSSTVESHRFLSLSNLDGDSNVPESELLATTTLVIQGARQKSKSTGVTIKKTPNP